MYGNYRNYQNYRNYRKRRDNRNHRRKSREQFIGSLNPMQIACFAIAAIAVFFGLVHSFSTLYSSGEESLAVTPGDSRFQSESHRKKTGNDSLKVSSTKNTTPSGTSTTTLKTFSVEEPALIDTLQPDDHSAKYFIVVYKGSQSVAVYGKGENDNYTKEIKKFTCSTGQKSSPTRTGKYRIRAKYRWRWLEGNVYGQYNTSISDDYLFHSVPYLQQDASTMDNHEYDKLGTPASKGCIRMCVRDCKWIYDNCSVGTDVRIVDDSGPSGSRVPARIRASGYSGWDPSDKWSEENPYFQ